MLAAGGMSILSDGKRKADGDNSRGYLEWERIPQLPRDPACISEAGGKAVRVVSLLPLSPPEGHDQRVIFMHRPLAEVLASPDMLRNRGTAVAAFERNLRAADARLDSKPNVKTLRVPCNEVLNHPEMIAEKIARCMGTDRNVEGNEPAGGLGASPAIAPNR